MVNRFGIDQGFFTTDTEWMGNGWGLRLAVLGLIQIVSVRSVVNGFGIDQDFFYHGYGVDGEWMGFEISGLGS